MMLSHEQIKHLRLQFSQKVYKSTKLVKYMYSIEELINPSILTVLYISLPLLQVLQYGTPLLSSTGEEFAQLDTDPDYQKMSFQVMDMYNKENDTLMLVHVHMYKCTMIISLKTVPIIWPHAYYSLSDIHWYYIINTCLLFYSFIFFL